jgi:4-hydroxy-tetrahydrodipicolinate synthase
MPNTIDPERLRTVQIVPITAFDPEGEIALEPMRELFTRLYDAGMRVFIPCAGSAEFHSLQTKEIVAVIEMARGALGPDAVLLAPVGLQIGHALSVGAKSLEAGADGVLIMPFSAPYLSDAGARDYYQALLDELGCPAIIYKKAEVPSDDLLLELADHPQVVGIKYAVNDLDAFQRIVIAARGKEIEFQCGSAERFAPFFMLAGATGYTSGAGNLCPRLTLSMHSAAMAGDWEETLRLQEIIRPIEDYRARSGSSYNISFQKHALKSIGLDFGPPRPPQRQLTAEEMREIDRIVEPILKAEEELATVGSGR